MINRLMMSVAAIALIAGTGLANAQATGGRESGGAAAQQTAPSTAPAAGGGASSGAVQPNAEPSSGMKSTQSDQKPTGATKSQRAEDNLPGQKSKGMSSETKGQAKDMKAEGREGQGNNMKAEGRQGRDKDMKAEGREGHDNNMKAEGREGHDNNMKAEGREGRDNNKMNAETKSPNERSQTTVGVAGTGAQLSTEQRTKITSVIREQHVAPITNVNFSIAVGTRIPREVTFHTLPTSVVTIYPEWRGYDYILVRDQILVIDPRSHEIVAILDV